MPVRIQLVAAVPLLALGCAEPAPTKSSSQDSASTAETTVELCVRQADGEWVVETLTEDNAAEQQAAGSAEPPGTWYADEDGDGYGAPDTTFDCAGSSRVEDASDCDDHDSAVHPDRLDDLCDGIDQDCDGEPDEDVVPVATTCGFGACGAVGALVCDAGTWTDTCVPADPTPEVCDGHDNDCDGLLIGDVEMCRDDNSVDGDGCSAECRPETCWEGPLQTPSEVVDCSPVRTAIAGPDAIDDAMLINDSSGGQHNTTHGSRTQLSSGSTEWHSYWRTVVVLRIDLSAIPEGATILRSELQLVVADECSAVGGDPSTCGSLDPDTWALSFTELAVPWTEDEVSYTMASADLAWGNRGALGESDRRAQVASLDGLNSTSKGNVVLVDLTDSIDAFATSTRDDFGWIVEPPPVELYEARSLTWWSSEASSDTCEEWPVLWVEWLPQGC